MTLSTQDSIKNLDDANRIFANAIADQLAARIGTERFELWFAGRDCIVYHGEATAAKTPSTTSKIMIFAENNFSLQRVQNTFGQDIRQVVDRVCGSQVEIKYLLESDVSDRREAVTDAASQTAAASPTSPSAPAAGDHTPTIRFESEHSSSPVVKKPIRRGIKSFWFGSDNRLVKAGVDQVFETPGQVSPLFVYGATGSGKTHLLESLTNDFRRRLRLKRCLFLSAEQFTSEFVGSLRGGSGLPMFRRKYRDLDLLAIDDIQFLAGKRATLGEFQHTIDNLLRNGKQVVVAADRPPMELQHLGSDISARLSAGLTCPLQYPDFDGRMQIVRRMCTERNFNLSTNVLRMICEQLTRDVRRLSGAINRLHAYSVSTEEKITPEFAQKALCDLFSMTGPNCTSMVTIEEAVCEFCGVAPAELKSPSRQKRISSARMLAMYLSRQYTGSAFSEIGEFFGGRSHSTVIAAERKVAQWLKNDDGISVSNAVYPAQEVIRRIESNLRIG